MESTDPTKRKIKRITYFCFADAQEWDPLYKDAFELAKYLGEKGYDCVNGGGPGAMRATSEGAKAGGAQAIGATFFPKDIMNFEGRDKKNPLDEEIVEKNYVTRTLKLLELGDAYIVLRGGTGTISEFGMAWGLARLYFGHHKPLILYGDFWYEIMQAFGINMRIRADDLKVYKICSTPEEVYNALQIFDDAIELRENPDEHERAFQLFDRIKFPEVSEEK
jgi:uncharacterized protein (TIGR00730 family)